MSITAPAPHHSPLHDANRVVLVLLAVATAAVIAVLAFYALDFGGSASGGSDVAPAPAAVVEDAPGAGAAQDCRPSGVTRAC